MKIMAGAKLDRLMGSLCSSVSSRVHPWLNASDCAHRGQFAAMISGILIIVIVTAALGPKVGLHGAARSNCGPVPRRAIIPAGRGVYRV